MTNMRFRSSHWFVIFNKLCVCVPGGIASDGLSEFLRASGLGFSTSGRHGFNLSKCTMLVILFTIDWMRYMASETLSNTVYGPIHGQRNLYMQAIHFGTTGLNSMTKSPVFCGSP